MILGRVVGIHGVRGEIKVFPHSGTPENLLHQQEVFLRNPDHQRICRRTIRSARAHKKMTLLCLEGISSPEEARQLVGSDVLVDKSKLPPLSEGEYYWFQIQGLQVVTLDRQHLGHVEELISTPDNDVYVVRGGDEEILIPATEEVIHRIDLEERVMVVDLPEGLRE